MLDRPWRLAPPTLSQDPRPRSLLPISPWGPGQCPFLSRSSRCCYPVPCQLHSSPWLHLDIQVCGRPWMPPSSFFFFPSAFSLVNTTGFCSRTIAWFCPGPWGLSLGLPKPIYALQGSERNLFCSLGLLAKDWS